MMEGCESFNPKLKVTPQKQSIHSQSTTELALQNCTLSPSDLVIELSRKWRYRAGSLRDTPKKCKITIVIVIQNTNPERDVDADKKCEPPLYIKTKDKKIYYIKDEHR